MEIDDFGDTDQNISAYAKLEFDQFSFFIQTLTLVVGRKAKRDDNVDVHLGMSKSISRIHAKIYYQFDAMSWEIEVLGKNGAFVNEQYVEAGGTCELKNTDRLQIAEASFIFLLPEGAAAPANPFPYANNATHLDSALDRSSSLTKPLQTALPGNDPHTRTHVPMPVPVAPHHLMQSKGTLTSSAKAHPVSDVVEPTQGQTAAKLVTLKLPVSKTGDAELSSAVYSASDGNPAILDRPTVGGKTAGKLPTKKPRKKYTRKIPQVKAEDSIPDVSMTHELWPLTAHQFSSSPEMSKIQPPGVPPPDFQEAPEDKSRTEEERKLMEEESAAQHAAQLLHQERLTRQAQEEEEGLILPPPETDPAVIASFQKPTASYATMIYNAINSHEKKKMTLAQIYSWICIYHPYYRYVQNGWQNSIRHNLSLNKAFMKVPRTDDEPGKGSFWAVDPESEMLFEGGIYKKKPPRPLPSVPISRGSPVVMKDGKLALNPNFFVGGLQGKAEDVLRIIHLAVQRQSSATTTPEQASQLARIITLALATQLRQSVVSSAIVRPVIPQQAVPRPTMPHQMPQARPYQSYGSPITHQPPGQTTTYPLIRTSDNVLQAGLLTGQQIGQRAGQIAEQTTHDSGSMLSQRAGQITGQIVGQTSGQKNASQVTGQQSKAQIISETGAQPATPVTGQVAVQQIGQTCAQRFPQTTIPASGTVTHRQSAQPQGFASQPRSVIAPVQQPPARTAAIGTPRQAAESQPVSQDSHNLQPHAQTMITTKLEELPVSNSKRPLEDGADKTNSKVQRSSQTQDVGHTTSNTDGTQKSAQPAVV